MTRHRQISYGSPIPQDFLDQIQEYISTLISPNATVNILSANTVQIPAGTDNAQVTMGINGRFRYITSAVNATHPGGAAGTYNLWATCSTDNNFAIGPPEVDNTIYTFSLQILPVGNTPSTALFRQIGTVIWNGTTITDAYLLNDFPSDGITSVPSLRTLGSGAQQAAAGTAPAAAVAAIPVDAVVGTGSLRTIGTGSQQAAPGTEAATRAAAVTAITPLTGILSARPSATGLSGKIYYATDNGIPYISDGSTWTRLDTDAATRLTTLETRVPASVGAFKTSGGGTVPGTGTPLSLGAVQHQFGPLSTMSGGTSFTIPAGQGGIYTYSLEVSFSGSGVGTTGVNLHLQLNRSGGGYNDIDFGASAGNGSGGTYPSICLSSDISLFAGDVFQVLMIGGTAVPFSCSLSFRKNQV